MSSVEGYKRADIQNLDELNRHDVKPALEQTNTRIAPNINDKPEGALLPASLGAQTDAHSINPEASGSVTSIPISQERATSDELIVHPIDAEVVARAAVHKPDAHAPVSLTENRAADFANAQSHSMDDQNESVQSYSTSSEYALKQSNTGQSSINSHRDPDFADLNHLVETTSLEQAFDFLVERTDDTLVNLEIDLK